MKISKAKYDALKSRGRKAARATGRGVKANGIQVVAGAATALVSGALVKAAPQLMSFAWWAEPVVLGVAGVLAKRSKRLTAMGDAVLGAAGYAGVVAYRTRGPGAEAGRVIGRAFRPALVPAPAVAALPSVSVPAAVPSGVSGVRAL